MRKPIQIAVTPEVETESDGFSSPAVYALCDDGTIWRISEATTGGWGNWKPVPLIPLSDFPMMSNSKMRVEPWDK